MVIAVKNREETATQLNDLQSRFKLHHETTTERLRETMEVLAKNNVVIENFNKVLSSIVEFMDFILNISKLLNLCFLKVG
jgi:hypothetical protein